MIDINTLAHVSPPRTTAPPAAANIPALPGSMTSGNRLAVRSGERQIPVFCPQCGTRIEVRKGLCGNRLIDAILLQAERIGTELECQRCQSRFVFQKLGAIPENRRERNQKQVEFEL